MASRNGVSRRTVLKQSVAASVSVAAPYFIPSGVLAAPGRPGANGRVILGFIGCGGRARQLMDHVPADGKIVAICDCFRQRYADTLKKRASCKTSR